MNTHTKKRWLWAGMTCLMLAPAGAMAQDYLKGKTSYQSDGANDIGTLSGDTPQDFRYSGSINTSEERAKRQRVETRVKEYMSHMKGSDDIHEHDDREELTSEQFNALVARAQSGDAKAIGEVGYAFENGIGTAKNEQQALEWYKRAIEYGEGQYYSNIGKMYRDYSPASGNSGFLTGLRNAMTSAGTSNNLPDNDLAAREWFEKGVYAKDWESYTQLGIMYRDGDGGLPKDMEKAKWYYDEGLRLKKEQDSMALMEMEQRFRAKAEVEEGLRSPETPVLGWVKEASHPGVMIGDSYCTLRDMGTPSVQFTAFYEAYCSGLSESVKRDAPTTVTVKGATCNVTTWPANDAGKDFELRCR